MRAFRRQYATAPLEAAKLQITRCAERKVYPPPDKLVFGHVFTDHMLIADWSADKGWHAPQIRPFGDMPMHPASCVFHYGFECFEGMKAFKDVNGELRMFRADRNVARLKSSSTRLTLPGFDEPQALELLQRFVRLEESTVPKGRGFSLYIRPTMIGTQPTLGIRAPDNARLFVIASPVGPYYASGFKAIKLEATDWAVRAWPLGTGDKKLGGNYAPCVLPQQQSAARGYAQNLWLFDGYLTEVGSMNLFLVFKNPDGTSELVTPPLDGTILEGITRLSILELARERLDKSQWTVSERKVHIDEVIQRQKKGELLEVFGAGTAAIVSPVKEIGYHGKPITVPMAPDQEAGPLTAAIQQWVQDIQYGVVDHHFCPVVPHFD